MIDHRDRAVLLLGFAGGFRRSELAALTVEDLEDHPEGLLVHVRHSKTDQESAGRRIEIVYGEDHTTCPIVAIRRWQAEADITEGPLLRSVNRHGQPAPPYRTGPSR